jgi:hypothetical protein
MSSNNILKNIDREWAIKQTGGLSSVSKMPGMSYGLPAFACITGSRIREIAGSVCSKCYGRKGHYPRATVKNAQYRRLKSLKNGSNWIWGMAYLITRSKSKYFRWHDTGDIQSLAHLVQIVQVCMLTPNIKHRLPTKEIEIVRSYLKMYRLPDNLVIRISSPFIGDKPRKDVEGLDTTSTVNTNIGFKCPATRTRKICGNCRACWSRKIKNIDYKLH